MNKLLLLAVFLVVLYFFLQSQSTAATQATVQTAGSIVNGLNIKELVETSMLLKQFQ
jgi:hypothetical protein